MIESIEQGRKEDGSRSIADKIKSRLHDLDKTVETNYGRWVWELLQNAKDSISDVGDSSVSVQIELNDDSVVFSHNGSYFKELDIRGLINQISSKEVEEGVQTRNTGRFGTGFLTTHLLSRKVEISGIVKTMNEEFHSFNFLLDREGKTTAILAPKVEASWKGFQESTKKIDSDYDKKEFNTSFRYLLNTEEQKEISKKGIIEFAKLIPFVLTFIPKIKSVAIRDNTHDSSLEYRNTQEVIDDVITRIEKIENSHASNILIIQLKDDKVSIATEVEKTDTGYSIKDMKDIPKLFCDFPLIGTENFHFPVVVNSFYFSPQTERDGIWLKGVDDEEVIENQQLLKNSVKLFQDLVNKISERNYFDLYNIVSTKIPATDERYFDKAWYIKNIQKPLKEFLKQAKLVETPNDKTMIGDVYFPDKALNKEASEKIWQFSSDLKVNKLPIKEHIQKWTDVIWSDCSTVDIDDLVTDLKGKENISILMETLEVDESKMFDWLKKCLTFIYENNDSNYPISEIIPNQEGVFKTSRELYLDEIDDDVLKRISKLAGYSYYKELVHQGLFLEEYPHKKNIENIATKITSLINDENESEERSLAITMLIEWFGDNEESGKKYFESLYTKKEKLLVDTIKDKDSLFSILNSEINITEIADLVSKVKKNPDQIQESITKAKELDELLKEYGANNIAELKELIISGNEYTSTMNNSTQVVDKVEITQEVLLSLGVTTPQELIEVLKDKNISEQFIHTSTPTTEMFQYAQKKIERAKNNIIDYLQKHEDYDCSDLEELASTVLGGIKKKALDLFIVVRPSDNKQVIIYYTSEKDSLDYENAELWVENGKTIPYHLTLGKILKNTGITRIPV